MGLCDSRYVPVQTESRDVSSAPFLTRLSVDIPSDLERYGENFVISKQHERRVQVTRLENLSDSDFAVNFAGSPLLPVDSISLEVEGDLPCPSSVWQPFVYDAGLPHVGIDLNPHNNWNYGVQFYIRAFTGPRTWSSERILDFVRRTQSGITFKSLRQVNGRVSYENNGLTMRSFAMREMLARLELFLSPDIEIGNPHSMVDGDLGKSVDFRINGTEADTTCFRRVHFQNSLSENEILRVLTFLADVLVPEVKSRDLGSVILFPHAQNLQLKMSILPPTVPNSRISPRQFGYQLASSDVDLMGTRLGNQSIRFVDTASYNSYCLGEIDVPEVIAELEI